MKHWIVCTPQYEHYYGSIFLMEEPPEYIADCASVEGNTKREAKIAAIKHPNFHDWVMDQRSSDMNPFTGLKVYDAGCPHGNCWCDICTAKTSWVECEQCLEEWEKEDESLWEQGNL